MAGLYFEEFEDGMVIDYSGRGEPIGVLRARQRGGR